MYGVARYCAGTGRLRHPAMQAHLDGPLDAAAELGWRLDWQAVRRRLNEAADGLAGLGLAEVARRAARGDWGVHVAALWEPTALARRVRAGAPAA